MPMLYSRNYPPAAVNLVAGIVGVLLTVHVCRRIKQTDAIATEIYDSGFRDAIEAMLSTTPRNPSTPPARDPRRGAGRFGWAH